MVTIRSTDPLDTTAAALAYARRGWAVFPLHTWRAEVAACSCRNPTCASPAKHPLTPNGVHDASTDRNQVLAWWSRWPGANVGLATGGVSGVWVLDIDADKGGIESYADLVRSCGEPPDTVGCETGGGGTHLYWAMPAWALANAVGLLPGIDVRGDGGYVVAPPSRHRSGNRYVWHVSGHPEDMDPVPAPRWLLDLVRARSQRRAEPLPDVFVEGMRDNALTSAAGALRHRGLGERAILAALEGINAVCARPPLPDADLARIARSVARYTPAGGDVSVATPEGARRLGWLEGEQR